MQKLLSASEIAQLKLPGLPTSRDNIRARAEREGWYAEDVVGRGGVRRVYQLPEKYLNNAALTIPSTGEARSAQPAPAMLDIEKLQMVETVLDRVLRQKGLALQSDKRGSVVACMYDYAVRGGEVEAIETLLTALVA